MTTVRVFDPAMCCSTGVCGPSVDPELVRFAADLDWLKDQGVSVERFNLAHDPASFASDAEVKEALETKGEAGLPVVKVDDVTKSMGRYPSRAELAEWSRLGSAMPGLFTEAVSELVAIGAAVASNCETCFKFHYDKARKLGVSKEDMMRAVAVAEAVKAAPAKSITDLALRHLGGALDENRATARSESSQEPKSSGCCAPKSEGATSNKSGCC